MEEENHDLKSSDSSAEAKAKKKSRIFTNSADYWEKRYTYGGNSGAGSYNRLARFKAEFLNEFVEQNEVETVFELGCGDGAQLSLAKYPSYIGFDASPKAVEICKEKYHGQSSKRFFHITEISQDLNCDLGLSLDVIYHLVEDNIFNKHMEILFTHAQRYVIIYSSNYEQVKANSHVRHRKFTSWVEMNRTDWKLAQERKNIHPFDLNDPANTSFADFYVFEKS